MGNDQEKKKVLRELNIKEFEWDLEGFPVEKHDNVKAKDVTFDWDNAVSDRRKKKSAAAEDDRVSPETATLIEESKIDRTEVFNWSQGHTTKLDKDKVKWAPDVEQITAEELVEIQMNAAIEQAMQTAESLKYEEDSARMSSDEEVDHQYLPKGYEERAERDVKLHKFYTFNKKNAEFQALLDQEYERLREKIRLEAEEEAKLQVKMAAFDEKPKELDDVANAYLEQIKVEEQLEENVASNSLPDEVAKLVKADVQDVVSQVHGKAAELDEIAVRTMEELALAKKEHARKEAENMILDWGDDNSNTEKNDSAEDLSKVVSLDDGGNEEKGQLGESLKEADNFNENLVEKAAAVSSDVGDVARDELMETKATKEVVVPAEFTTAKNDELLDSDAVGADTDTGTTADDNSDEKDSSYQDADPDEMLQPSEEGISRIFKEVLNPAQIEEIVALAWAVRNTDLGEEEQLEREELPDDLELVEVKGPVTPEKIDLAPDVSGLNPNLPSFSSNTEGEDKKTVETTCEKESALASTSAQPKARSGFVGACGDEKKPGLEPTDSELQEFRKQAESTEDKTLTEGSKTKGAAVKETAGNTGQSKKKAVDYTCIFDDDFVVDENSKKQTKKEKKRLAKEAKKAQKQSLRSDEREGDEIEGSGEKKLWFLDTLIILLVILLIVLGIGIVAPNTYIGGKINYGFNAVVNKLVGGDDSSEKTKGNKQAETQKTSLNDAVEKAEALKLSDVKITANPKLKLPEWAISSLASEAKIKPYISQIWYTDSNGKTVSYEDEVVKSVYGYYSALPSKINDGSDQVLDYIDPDSTLYVQTKDIAVNGAGHLGVFAITIGEIGFDGEYFYVPVIVKGDITKGKEETTDVLKLKAADKKALIVDIATE